MDYLTIALTSLFWFAFFLLVLLIYFFVLKYRISKKLKELRLLDERNANANEITTEIMRLQAITYKKNSFNLYRIISRFSEFTALSMVLTEDLLECSVEEVK